MANDIVKKTVVNTQGKNTTTVKTTIPALIRDVLQLESKDVLIWKLNMKKGTVTLEKEENKEQ